MPDAFLEHPFFLNRHRHAPLLNERDSFLNHLQQQGTSRKALRNLSAELLQVVRLLKLTEMRDVSLEGIRRAAQGWAREQRTNPKARSYGNSARFFAYAAKKWLRFHGRLKLPSVPPMRFADQRLRPVHDRGARSLAVFGAVPLLENVEVPGMVRESAPVVGDGEDRRR